MSDLKRLAASVIIARLEPEEYKAKEEYRNHIKDLIDKGILGFCVFKGELEFTRSMIQELQTYAKGNLLFCGDFEHGISMRIEGGTDFPHAMALGSADNPESTEKVAYAIAHETRALGVHWNFAPVCDINSNTQNPIINIRAFGETPVRVQKHSTRFIQGLQSGNVIACAKHFPGHGDTATDSHLGLPILDSDKERILNHELLPFQTAIKAGVRSVMIAHMGVPALDPSGLPASLSHSIISGLLREAMGFDGIVVTDALDMGAITQSFTCSQAATMAVKAGVDVLLIPENPIEAIEALATEAERDENVKRKLIESQTKINKEKEWVGLGSDTVIPPVNLQENGSLAFHIARAAVKVSGNRDLIPIEKTKQFAAFAVMQTDNAQPGVNLFHFIQQIVETDCDFGFMNADITDEEINAYRDQTEGCETIIFALFIRPRSHSGTVGIPERINEAAQRIANGRPVIAVLLGSPYIKEYFDADLYVTTYSDSLAGIAAAAVALTRGIN